ncbi:MAG: LacI family DNA-binding transcriptional regulator [Eubacteriales bacterium]
MKYTISDIAQMCGVSKATVSRIINNKDAGFSQETKRLVLDKIEQLGYRPNVLARSISVSSSCMIGMIVPELRNPVQIELVCGVEDFLREHNYSLILAQSKHQLSKERELLISMVDKRADGVILCSGNENTEFLQEYRRYHMPISLIGRTFDKGVSDASIGGDNKAGIMTAMNHLVDKGHTAIALLDGRIESSGAQQRLEGYRQVLLERGIPFDSGLVDNSDYSYQAGCDMINRLQEKNRRFTAVLTGGDIIAVGVLSALRAHEIKVPDEVEVIGFDDLEISRIHSPTISTLRKPHYSMATMATQMLLEVIDGNPPDISHLSVVPELVLRETTR